MPAALLRVAVGAAFVGLVVGLNAPAARAEDDANPSAWSKLMQSMGLKKPPGADPDDIDYRERPPLVVPPGRNLPPPAANAAVPTADWPREPAQKVKNAKAKPEIVPDTAVQTPNPPVEKKPWYNPAGWFNREEYANFAGEPVRGHLTDPPAGYRVPSADQPYGIGPEKKKPYAPTAADKMLTPANGGGH